MVELGMWPNISSDRVPEPNLPSRLVVLRRCGRGFVLVCVSRVSKYHLVVRGAYSLSG